MVADTSSNTAPESHERGHKRYVYRRREFDPNGQAYEPSQRRTHDLAIRGAITYKTSHRQSAATVPR
jgi:hypothetical protein